MHLFNLILIHTLIDNKNIYNTRHIKVHINNASLAVIYQYGVVGYSLSNFMRNRHLFYTHKVSDIFIHTDTYLCSS